MVEQIVEQILEYYAGRGKMASMMKELTDEEWEEVMRLDEMLYETTPEEKERFFQEMKEFEEKHKELLSQVPSF